MTCAELFETLSPEDQTYFFEGVMWLFSMALSGIDRCPSRDEAFALIEEGWADAEFSLDEIPVIVADCIDAGEGSSLNCGEAIIDIKRRRD